jgi:ParB family chromosome partitioning protein
MWMFGKEEREKGRGLVELPIEKISYGRFQPRFEVNEEELQALVESIKAVGVLQPILVRSRGEKYELIAGERRLRASIILGLQDIPALVRELSDNEATEAALIENLQRKNLHFFEEAEGYSKLVSEYQLTQQQVAQKMGLSQSTIANKLRLLNLDPGIRRRIYILKLGERHARALLELENKDDQDKLLKIAEKKEFSVIEWEMLIKREKERNISREINTSRKRRIKPLVKDLRLFINSLERAARTMRDSGMDVKIDQVRDGNKLKIVIEVDAKND